MTVDSPKAQVFLGLREGCSCFANVCDLRAAKNVAQFLLGVFQNSFLFFRQIFPGSIDVEVQHRHRGLVRCALTAVAMFGGVFQRTRDLARIS